MCSVVKLAIPHMVCVAKPTGSHPPKRLYPTSYFLTAYGGTPKYCLYLYILSESHISDEGFAHKYRSRAVRSARPPGLSYTHSPELTAMKLAFLGPFISLATVVSGRTFTVYNGCPFTIW